MAQKKICLVHGSAGKLDEEDDSVRQHDLVVVLHLFDGSHQFQLVEDLADIILVDLLVDPINGQRLRVFFLEQFEQR